MAEEVDYEALPPNASLGVSHLAGLSVKFVPTRTTGQHARRSSGKLRVFSFGAHFTYLVLSFVTKSCTGMSQGRILNLLLRLVSQSTQSCSQ
jgi:hypothetical protein